MKYIYEEPTLFIINLEKEDVIMTSGLGEEILLEPYEE